MAALWGHRSALSRLVMANLSSPHSPFPPPLLAVPCGDLLGLGCPFFIPSLFLLSPATLRWGTFVPFIAGWGVLTHLLDVFKF